MKFHVLFLFAIIAFTGIFTTASAQVGSLQQSQIDSVIGQITNSTVATAVTGISGDGRLIVFESAGDIATENPRNADGNREIFLFDYAQRRIFQITNTLSLRTSTTGTYASSNLRVLITNLRPVISNDGRWIAFGSNATTATPNVPNATNPGNFNAESFNPTTQNPSPNPLLVDANTEIWLYQIPAVAAVNLSAGDEAAAADLSAGTFTRVTNSLTSRAPIAGSSTSNPLIGDDNRDATIDDSGNFIAFTSNRDLVTGGNTGNDANNEIFTYARALNQINQITTTSRGTALDAILNLTPTISGNGLRVAFQSNANKPIADIAESNTERNYEVFVADLNASGALPVGGFRKQITVTAPTSAGDPVNILDFGKRMSRDGRYIALDSYADLRNENNGANYTSFALYLYDVQSAIASPTTNAFRRIGPRSDADATISGGEVAHFGGFTDYADGSTVPQTLVLESRQNIIANGTVAATGADGLNPNETRPPQIYAYPLDVAAGSATFKRLTKLPALTVAVSAIQPITSNSVRRMTFNLSFTEIGTGNSDLSSEAYYFLLPVADAPTAAGFNFATGASLQSVSASPVPTPSPTATPTPTPTPTTTPSPTPTPTPQTPPAVQGVSPGMLVVLNYNSSINSPVVPRTAVGDISRRFTLPIELSGVTLTVNGAAAGLKSVSSRQITFVVPPGLTSALTGTSFPIVVNNNGVVFRSTLTIVPTRPDIFTFSASPGPNGRARIFNITNPVFTTEPFTVTTLRYRGGRRVPTVMRLFLTGIEGVPLNNANVPVVIRIRDVNITPTTAAVLREPGVYSLDFIVPATLLGAGDVPIVVTITAGGVTFQSRLDDTAPRLRFL